MQCLSTSQIMTRNCITVINFLITDTVIPASPSPPALEESSSFPVAALAVIPLVILLIIIVIVVVILVHWRWKKHHTRKTKIAPADEDDTELAAKKSIFDGEVGIRLTRAESFKILSKKSSFDGNDDDDDDDAIQVTRTKSLTVIVPPGQYVYTCCTTKLWAKITICIMKNFHNSANFSMYISPIS